MPAMKRLITPIAFALVVLPSMQAAFARPPIKPVPDPIAGAMNDPARGDDVKDDQRRQMHAVMEFTQVKLGDKVAEIIPGQDYWTIVFSGIVGQMGHVYTIWPDETAKYARKGLARLDELHKMPRFRNISALHEPAADFSVPEKVDLVFTCQNYHDYHNPFMGPVNMAAFNKQVFDSLKPGGYYVVIDHVAPAGSGTSDTNTLHRIDPAVVKKEVEAAGFVFDGESDALRNPDDPHDVSVFDKSIRGHTDQFMYRFKKPE
jgi:predicted methyltransferase